MKKYYALAAVFLLSGCSTKRQKSPEELSSEELKPKITAALDKKQKNTALIYLESLVTQHPDDQNISAYKLMLADLYFAKGRYPESYELYSHFHEMYPSDKRAEYAFYRAILAQYHQTLPRDCDATMTEKTRKLCTDYLNNELYFGYRKDVVDIDRTCCQKLIDKEVSTYNFYLRQGRLQSAENRLAHLRKTYLAESDDLEPRLLYLESKLAKQQKTFDILNEKTSLLIEKYPDSGFTRMAKNLRIPPASFDF